MFTTIVADDIPDSLMKRFTFVRKLTVKNQFPGHPFMITNATMQTLTNLTSLIIAGCDNIYNVGISKLTKLTHLDMRKNIRITNSGLRRLTQLRELDLEEETNITNKGISTLVNLKRINLGYDCEITDSCLSRLTNLTNLDIRNNREITDNSVKHLVNLRTLDLTFYNNKSTNLTYESISCLTNLTILHCSDYDIYDLLPKLKHNIIDRCFDAITVKIGL